MSVKLNVTIRGKDMFWSFIDIKTKKLRPKNQWVTFSRTTEFLQKLKKTGHIYVCVTVNKGTYRLPQASINWLEKPVHYLLLVYYRRKYYMRAPDKLLNYSIKNYWSE